MMAKYYSYLVLLFSHILLLLGSCSAEQTPTDEKTAETNATAISVEKPQPDRPKLKAEGQNEPLNVGTSAQNTLLELAPPQLWYELKGCDGEVVKVQLSKEDSAEVDALWKKLARYHAIKRYSSDGNEKAQSAYDHTISGVGLMNRLRGTKIKVSNNDTELTEVEISELLGVQANLFRLRLEEVLEVFPEMD